MKFPGFVSGTYVSQSPIADQERTVNFFPEKMESQGADSEWTLYPTPGVQKISTAGTSPGRAHFYIDGREFAVEGTKFIEISRLGVITVRGTVSIGSDPATISSNGDGGDELLITSGGNAYCFNRTTSAFAAVAAMAGKATMGDALDGYFLILDATTSTLWLSDLLDGLTWDPTMFAQRTIAADPWVAMKVNGRYVWLVGDKTSEIWYDSGQGNFPFAPHPSGLVSFGTAAPFSVASADGQIMWLGASAQGDGMVFRATGFSPEPVSDYALQWAFSRFYTLADAVAETFNYSGHLFYRISFPTANCTWCWDAQLNKWFEWQTWISEENRYVACRSRFHAMAFGEHRMLDSETGSIYRMSAEFGLDVDGRPILRERRAPGLSRENERIFYSSFELMMEPGIGIEPFTSAILPVMDTTAALALGLIPGIDFVTVAQSDSFIINPPAPRQGWNPMVMLSWSNDGGKTWSTELLGAAGKSGNYTARVKWYRLGVSRDRVFRVRTSDPWPARIIDAYLTLGQSLKGQAA